MSPNASTAASIILVKSSAFDHGSYFESGSVCSQCVVKHVQYEQPTR